MAGKIVVSEILSDASSSNTVKIGSGMTLDLNSQGTTVLPASIPAANLTGSLPAISGASLTGITTGKVLQVVNAENTNSSGWALTTTASTYQDIPGASVSITPASTSNYLLIMVDIHFDVGGGGADVGMSIELYRGSTRLRSGYSYITHNQLIGNTNIIMREQVVSTSAQIFSVAAKTYGGGTLYVGSSEGSYPATITIMEIAG